MNWLFWGIIIFVFIFAAYGYNRGLARMIYSVSAFLISIIAMVVIAPIAANVLHNSEPVMESIQKPIEEIVVKQIDEGLDVDQIIDNCHLPSGLDKNIRNIANENILDKEGEIASVISETLAEYVCDILAYISIFIIVRIVLFIVSRVIHVVEHLPVIKKLNKAGGALLSVVEAIGCIWLFFMLADVLSTTKFGITVRTMIWENELLRILYNINPLLFFIK